jgi:hypothetical protein
MTGAVGLFGEAEIPVSAIQLIGRTRLPGGCRMKRRTYRKLRAEQHPEHHHNIHVVLLDPAAGRLRAGRAANPCRDPEKPCVYVGMTSNAGTASKPTWART